MQLQEALAPYHAERKEIANKYAKLEVWTDSNGNKREQMRVPLDANDAYQGELIEIGNKTVDVDFGVETFSFLSNIWKDIFDREDVKEHGIAALFNPAPPTETVTKYVNEVERALADSKSV